VLKVLFFGFLYEIGFLPIRQALTRVFKVMRGANVDLLTQKFSSLPLTPNTSEVFAELKAQGCKIALISSGLPTFLVEKLASLVGVEYAVGIEVGVKNNILTGEVWGDVIQREGKFLVLKELLENEKLSPSDCVVVADDRNNASILLKDILKIGYEPDFIVRMKADAVVTGKLTKILPVINTQAKLKKFPSRNDFVREVIHASGFFVPVLALLFGVAPIALFILTVAAIYAFSELSRIRGKNIPIFSAITQYAASQSELCQFTLAPIYFAGGILLTLLLFPAPANYAAIAILALGDSTASLFGGTISKRGLPLNKAKTLEGSVAGFSFAFLAGSVFVSPWIALVGAAIGMIVEYLPLPVNDNLLIPFSAVFALTFLV